MINPQNSKFFRRATIVTLVAYTMALVCGTHWPHMPAIGPEGSDKLLHFSAYAGLAVLFTLSFFWDRRISWRQCAMVWVALAIFGGTDELTQPPFQRDADWFDWFADCAGITFGLIVALILNRWLRARLQGNDGTDQ
jgi:VanZ family protein